MFYRTKVTLRHCTFMLLGLQNVMQVLYKKHSIQISNTVSLFTYIPPTFPSPTWNICFSYSHLYISFCPLHFQVAVTYPSTWST